MKKLQKIIVVNGFYKNIKKIQLKIALKISFIYRYNGLAGFIAILEHNGIYQQSSLF
jgi:hypothetical protein